MGSLATRTEACTEDIDFGGANREDLLHLRSTVQPNGGSVNFELHCTNVTPFIVKVPFAQLGAVWTEIHSASAMMASRQGLTLDRGEEKLLELCSAALVPRQQTIIPDPYTGDQIYVLEFNDHAPIAIRMSPGALHACQVKTIQAQKRYGN